MAWFGDGLPSLSNLKGQITNFTKEVLTEGIVDEIDDRSSALNEVNERCVQLQELLNSKDAEISLLRRQNCELQKAVVELNAKPKDSNDVGQDEEGEVFFWDPPPSAKNRNSKSQNHARQLQEQLAQATMKIRDLESELKRIQKVNNSTLKDEIPEGHQKAEFLRVKQDMMNRIIQMEEKTREAERKTKLLQLDETTLVNDFRTVLSKLNSLEKRDLLRGALRALETEGEKYSELKDQEKSDCDEKFKILNAVEHESVALNLNFDVNLDHHKGTDEFKEASSNREFEMHKKIEELQEENKRLFNSIEELDQQHAESIDKLLSMKEEIEKKHQCLQNAYEQLYVDHNQAQDKVTRLESKIVELNGKIQSESTCRSVQTTSPRNRDADVQTEIEETSGGDAKETYTVDELTQRIKNILKNSCIDTAPGESIFEAIARQYVDAKWKKDTLEKKVTEITRDLKEGMESKETMQVECDDMQAHIDSLLLEIQDLKLNLPSIPEASEERVACLETETESLQEEVKCLQTENASLREENVKLLENVLEDAAKKAKSSESEVALTGSEPKHATTDDLKDTIESLTRGLRSSVEKNNELQKKIDLLESAEKQTKEQLRMSLEKCKGLDENIEFIEELKLDLENVKRELKGSVSNSKRLENCLTDLQKERNQLRMQNEDFFEKMKELAEAETSKSPESSTDEKNDACLTTLQSEFDNVREQKDYLQRNIWNMEKELHEALDRVDSLQCRIATLTQENENLSKEKSSLFEQLTSVQEESYDKIDLLNFEMSLLGQDHEELRAEKALKVEELEKIREELIESREKSTKLEKEFIAANAEFDKIRLENESLRIEAKTNEDLKAELDGKKSRIKELECEQMEIASTLESLMEAAEEKSKSLQSELKFLQAENQQLLSSVNENACDNEKLQVLAILEDRIRENDALKTNNDKLMREIIEIQNRLQSAIEGNKESSDMAKETIEGLSHIITRKDEEINALKVKLDQLTKGMGETCENSTILKNQRDELAELVKIKHNESVQYHGEIQKLTHLLNEQTSRIQNLLLEQNVNSSALAEKEGELLWRRNELQVLQQRLKNMEDSAVNSTETCGIVDHSRQSAENVILNEKCNALEAALIQEQSNNRMLQNQLNESQIKEANAAKELERLRQHLVEIETSYTEDALLAEEMLKKVEAKLQQADEKMKNSSTVYTSASIRANQQVETLQQQMSLIVQQRDDIQNKLSAAEDKVLSQTASLTNLQIVLEQFQQDKERDIVAATGRIQSKVNESLKKQEELSNELTNLKEQLAEAKECLQAASRLSEQLDKKTERIDQLVQEVDRLTKLVNTSDSRIEEAKQSGEGKVDKALIKNLFLGYLASSAADKSSVLRVFSTILDFNEAERDKAGLNSATSQGGWFSRLPTGSTVPAKDQEASLTAAFVRFLESESKPKPQLPALPIQTSPLPRPGHSRQHSTSSTQSTLLLSSVNLPTFPDFIPARNTGSILKEVLKDS